MIFKYASIEEECPPSKPAVKCPKSPCRNAECPRYPNATCTDDNCGACTAIFTDADDNILSEEKCKFFKSCDAHLLPALDNVCDVRCIYTVTGIIQPSASFTVIGNIGHIYRVSMNEFVFFRVHCFPIVAGKCEPGVRLVSCTTAPCDTASCPGVKQARCIDNYCGSCSAIFTDRIGHVLTEEQCRLPGTRSRTFFSRQC